jgi:hypothetical protein
MASGGRHTECACYFTSELPAEEVASIVGAHDVAIQSLVTAIRRFAEPPPPRRRRLGFRVKAGEAS